VSDQSLVQLYASQVQTLADIIIGGENVPAPFHQVKERLENIMRNRDAAPELLEALQIARVYVATELDSTAAAGHAGACGPESGCDGNCMAVAYQSDALHKIDAAIAKAEGRDA